jgi:hypothetical protein
MLGKRKQPSGSNANNADFFGSFLPMPESDGEPPRKRQKNAHGESDNTQPSGPELDFPLSSGPRDAALDAFGVTASWHNLMYLDGRDMLSGLSPSLGGSGNPFFGIGSATGDTDPAFEFGNSPPSNMPPAEESKEETTTLWPGSLFDESAAPSSSFDFRNDLPLIGHTLEATPGTLATETSALEDTPSTAVAVSSNPPAAATTSIALTDGVVRPNIMFKEKTRTLTSSGGKKVKVKARINFNDKTRTLTSEIDGISYEFAAWTWSMDEGSTKRIKKISASGGSGNVTYYSCMRCAGKVKQIGVSPRNLLAHMRNNHANFIKQREIIISKTPPKNVIERPSVVEYEGAEFELQGLIQRTIQHGGKAREFFFYRYKKKSGEPTTKNRRATIYTCPYCIFALYTRITPQSPLVLHLLKQHSKKMETSLEQVAAGTNAPEATSTAASSPAVSITTTPAAALPTVSSPTNAATSSFFSTDGQQGNASTTQEPVSADVAPSSSPSAASTLQTVPTSLAHNPLVFNDFLQQILSVNPLAHAQLAQPTTPHITKSELASLATAVAPSSSSTVNATSSFFSTDRQQGNASTTQEPVSAAAVSSSSLTGTEEPAEGKPIIEVPFIPNLYR